MLLADIKEVIKASPAIQIQGQITHLQRRAWNVLLANAYNELPDKEVHRVSVAELAAKLGFDSNNEDYLKDALRELRACEVKWNILGKNNNEQWGVAGLLAEARIEDGICFYQFPYTLRLKLHNPIMYTKLNLRLQNRFKSQYALILWEVCFDYFNVDRNQGETPFIPLKTFRELLGLENGKYSEFKDLNKKVIKSAIKAINDLTDYLVEVEQKRIGRKIAELKFYITRVKNLSVQESVFPDVEDLPPVAVELVEVGIDRTVAIEIANTEWDYINPNALPTPGDYLDFQEYVSEKIEVSSYTSGVNNIAGYVVEAIRNNYQNEVVKKAREVRAARAKEKALKDLEEVFQTKRANMVRQLIQAESELVEHAAMKVVNPIVCKRLGEYDTAIEAYQDGGAVKAYIDDILVKELCQEQFVPMIAAYEAEKARLLG